MPEIIPSLWFTAKAAEAAAFYASLIPDSRVDRVSTLAADSPSGPAGSVEIVEFTLMGRPFQAMSAGPYEPFNHAISFTIPCDTQAEVDRLWNGLSAGGATEMCGWLRDRYGVSWQIVPTRLIELLTESPPDAAARVAKAMLGMAKLDIAALEAAANG
jgi:predicted 3-demethylubiquinone-9 3-methyltransferase (glyoxalase superfamily)